MPWTSWTSERLGITLAILSATGFSLKAIFVKLAYAQASVDAITLLALRMGFAVPAVVWVILRDPGHLTRLTGRQWSLLTALGLLGYYGASILDFMGLQHISAGLERLILFTYPTLTLFLGVLFLGKSLSRRQIIALALTYAGIGLAFSHDLSQAQDGRLILTGAALVFASAVSYALYGAGAELAIRDLGAIRFSALAILISTLATQIHFFSGHSLLSLAQPFPVLGYGMAMALFSTILPIFWQSAAVGHIGAGRTALIGTVGPVLTIFFGWWFLDEALSAAQMAGAALVILGVLLETGRLPRRGMRPNRS